MRISAALPMKCPMPGCNQAGLKDLLPGHLLTKHNINSLVDIIEEDKDYGGNRYSYNMYSREWKFVKLDLDSSTTSVLLRHTPREGPKELHLLHQESTALGDRLQIRSLTHCELVTKRKYEIDVEVMKEQTYCYKSISTSRIDQHGGLLIPKMPDGVPSGKKQCRNRMLQNNY